MPGRGNINAFFKLITRLSLPYARSEPTELFPVDRVEATEDARQKDRGPQAVEVIEHRPEDGS